MKRRILLILLSLSMLTLTACSSLLDREYRSESRHFSQRSDTEDTSVLRGETYSDLVNDVQFFVSMGQSKGIVHLYQYTGDVDAALEAACQEVLTQDPLGSWALRDIQWSSKWIVSYYECTFSFHYRHTTEEIASIQSPSGTAGIRSAVQTAFSQFAPRLVLDINSYYNQQELLLNLVQEAYYADPAYAMGYPDVSIESYPADHPGSRCLVQINLNYPDRPFLLQQRAQSAASVASTLVGTTPAQGPVGFWLLYSRLSHRVDFNPTASASVYDALTSGSADSEGIALAYQLLCNQAGLPCQLVQGTLDGSPHWWNLVQLEDGWQHVDVTAGAPQISFLCTDGDMEERYTWDRDNLPPCGEVDLSPYWDTGVTQEPEELPSAPDQQNP